MRNFISEMQLAFHYWRRAIARSKINKALYTDVQHSELYRIDPIYRKRYHAFVESDQYIKNKTQAPVRR